MRGREYVVSLKPCGRGMVLETLRYADEVRKAQGYFRDIPDSKPDAELLDLADIADREEDRASSIPTNSTTAMSTRCKKLIERKKQVKGKKILEDVEEPLTRAARTSIDLMAALKKSVGGQVQRARARPRRRNRRHARQAQGAGEEARAQAGLTMELNPPVPFAAIDWDPWLRLGGAAIAGLLLGLDREVRGRAAGMRTHGDHLLRRALMTVSMHRALLSAWRRRIATDPLRVFEATGAFIGIIGAGLIVFSKGEVKNLTTAAHLWLDGGRSASPAGPAQWPLVVDLTPFISAAFDADAWLGFVETSASIFRPTREHSRMPKAQGGRPARRIQRQARLHEDRRARRQARRQRQAATASSSRSTTRRGCTGTCGSRSTACSRAGR